MQCRFAVSYYKYSLFLMWMMCVCTYVCIRSSLTIGIPLASITITGIGISEEDLVSGICVNRVACYFMASLPECLLKQLLKRCYSTIHESG